VVFEVGETVADPDVPLAVKPDPVHDVAFVEDHVSVEDWPLVIEVGFAESVAVGTGFEVPPVFTNRSMFATTGG
jgi:hypothetical protein